ncbi:hypothetical protein [Streptomyces sp. NPDC002692]
MTILAGVALTVVAFGHNGGHTTQNTDPQKPANHYLITFNQRADRAPRRAEPQPTVSYPIKFHTAKPKPRRPAAAVSYPIDFSTLRSSR